MAATDIRVTSEKTLAQTLVSTVEQAAAALDAAPTNPDPAATPQLLQVVKVQEKAGELAAAVIGATGQIPRKGVTHTWAHVAAEAVDVALTALTFIESTRPGAAAAVLSRYEKRLSRRGRDLAAAVAHDTAILRRRTQTLPGLAALTVRVLRVQTAAGVLADQVMAAIGCFGPALRIEDPAEWNEPIDMAFLVVTTALVVVETVQPGELTAVVTAHADRVATRLGGFATGRAT
jgi:hypothetical protein